MIATDYKTFKEILFNAILEYRDDECNFDEESKNDLYTEFKTTIYNWTETYFNKFDNNRAGQIKLIYEWALEYFKGLSPNNSNYWVGPDANGWYDVNYTMPEYNVGVLILLPDEDDHITTGMFDISNKWVVLDDYREVLNVPKWHKIPDMPVDW